MTGSPPRAFSLDDRTIWVAGHNGMVGSAIVRRLRSENCRLLTISRLDLDLRRRGDVEHWLDANRPDAIFLAAGTVGGIGANMAQPVEFLSDNILICTNVIDAAWRSGVQKLLFLGSSCAYPRAAPQPINEDSLLTGPPEPTNESYALAKIAGIKLCQAYRKQHGARFVSIMPTNLYGPHDNFDAATSHVLAALMAKIHDARITRRPSVDIWGSGTPRHEFLHVDDLADAAVHLMQVHESDVPINVGSGIDTSIVELAETMKSTMDYDGSFTFNRDKPDGSPRKLLDVSRLHQLGWKHRIELSDGIRKTYDWYRQHAANVL